MSAAETTFGIIDEEQSKQMLVLAERMAGVGHWLIDLRRNTLYWSDEIYRIHGVTPDTYEPELDSAIAFYHPDDIETVRAAVSRAVDDKQPFEFEARVIQPSGESRVVNSKSIVQLDETGNAATIFGIFRDVTDYRAAQEQLRESTERYDAAMRGSSFGFWDWDLRTDALYWSPRLIRQLGIEDENFEPTYGDFETRLHHDDRKRVASAIKAHLEARTPYDVEYRLRRADGSYAWMHSTGQAVWDTEGNPTRMAGSELDISLQKIDQQTRESVYNLLTDEAATTDRRIRGLLEIAVDYLDVEIGIVSRVEGDTYTIRHAADPAGNVRRGLAFRLGETYCTHTLSRDGVTAFAHAGQSEISGHPCYRNFGLETYIGIAIRVGGETYGTVNFSSSAARDKEFGPRERSFVAMVSQWVSYELSQQRYLEEMQRSQSVLKQQQRELDLIFNLVPARIWFKDDQNRILRLNHRAAESMGVTVEEAEGASTYDLFPEMAEKYHRDDLAVFESGEPLTDIVEEFTPKRGQKGWVSTDKVPYDDPQTGERRLVVVSQDITSLMQVQDDLEKKTALLEKSNKDLDAFAYVASHDLRAPMRGIENLAAWITEDVGEIASEETREHLELLRGRIKRLDIMLGDILKYSRAGKYASTPEDVDCAELLSELTAWFADQSTLKVIVEGEMPTLHLARTSLQQIFMNLISNAIKHHDRESGTVSIRCTPLADDFMFSVTDDGPGIPLAYREKIFSMFETLHRRDDIEGSGVGLTIVQRLVESLDGGIEIVGGEGRGTSFRFTVPRALEVRELVDA